MSSTAEKLRQQLKRKHDAEERALQVVVALLETGISRAVLVDAARYINVDYYSDVTTERAILLICGYPLCDNPLINVPRQKYRISLSQKKVYDLSELKNFCSDRCFRASKYFEAQLSTSPVWTFDDDQTGQPADDRPLRPVFIDDDRVTPAAGSGQVADQGKVFVLPTQPDVGSAAVVVSVHDIAARVDAVQLCESASSIVRVEGRDDDLSTTVGCDDWFGPDPATDSRPELEPRSVATALAATHMDDSSGPCNQSSLGLLSASSRSKALQDSTLADPLQTALDRLMEWRTTATTAWLLGDAARSSTSAAAETAAHLQDSQRAASPPPAISWRRAREQPVPQPSRQGADANRSPEPAASSAGDDYALRAVRFLVAGDRSAPAAATVASNEGAAGDGMTSDRAADDRRRTVPPSDEHGQDFIRRRLVAERLAKSLAHAEAVLGSDITVIIRRRNLSRLASSFRLTKDNVTLKPAEWLQVVLLLAYVITQDDKVANQKIQSALCRYGCTIDKFNFIKEQFCSNFV